MTLATTASVRLLAGDREPVRFKTTGNHTLSGLAATNTDSITPVAGDRVLVTEQTDETENGAYIASEGSWRRAPDFDRARLMVGGTNFYIREGATHAGAIWVLVTHNPDVGLDDIEFSESAIGAWAAGAGGSIFRSSRVGIGASTPGEKLTVVGEGATSATTALGLFNSGLVPLLKVRNDGLATVGAGTRITTGMGGDAALLNVLHGTGALPISTGGLPSVVISRYEAVVGTGSDGSDGPALMVRVQGASSRQPVAIVGYADNTAASVADVVGLYGVAIQNATALNGGGTNPTAYAAFFATQVNTAYGSSWCLQTDSLNNTGSDLPFANAVAGGQVVGGFDFNLAPAGNDGTVGIMLRATGAGTGKWDAGLGFPDKGVRTACIWDTSDAVHILYASTGAHTNGINLAGATFSGNAYSSPSFAVSGVGAVTAASVNKVAITAPASSATLTIANGKTLTASNTLTLTGTDASSIAFGAGGTIGAVGYSATGQIAATATNDNAAAGKVGEYLSGTGSAVSVVTATAKTIASVSLTAGDWDVEGTVKLLAAATTTITQVASGTGPTDNTLNLAVGNTSATLWPSAVTPGTAFFITSTTPTVRISISSTATYYLVGYASFGTDTLTMDGVIRARRVR